MIDVLAATVNRGELFGLVEFRWEFVIMIFNVLVLFLFLKWKLFGPVSEYMQKRRDKIKKSIADAKKKNDEADALMASYQDKLDNIHSEEIEILKEARQKAEARTAEMIKDAQDKIEGMLEKARNDIAAEREKSIADLKDDIAELAVMAASKIIDEELDEQKHVAIVDDIIERAGDASWHM